MQASAAPGKVSKIVLISSVPPLMLQTKSNPNGLPMSVFDDMREKVLQDRSKFFKDLSAPFMVPISNHPKTLMDYAIHFGCKVCKLD